MSGGKWRYFVGVWGWVDIFYGCLEADVFEWRYISGGWGLLVVSGDGHSF